MNGHLGMKSGPLAPTSCKLSKQMLVLQHMNAHYKKLQNVKSSIDMSRPKTLQTSVKSRDRMRRDGGNIRRPNSRPPSSRASSRASNHDEHFSSNQAYADDPIVDEIVREALAEQTHDPKDELRIQLDSARAPPPRSPYASKSSRRALYDSARSSAHSRPVSAKTNPEEAIDQGGDYLERHRQRFTDARPFQPRLLRKNVPSKLSQFRYYNRPKSAPSRRPQQPENEPTEVRAEQALLQEQKPESRLAENDPDKVRWLVQQAESARLREQMSKNSRFSGWPENDASHRHVADSDDPEEELKYLQFYSDMTNDILNRGIFTNKVLNQVFQHHLERNIHGLRVSRMREILQNIRTELGIPEDDRLDNTFGYGSVSSTSGFNSIGGAGASFEPRVGPLESFSASDNYQNDFNGTSDLKLDLGTYAVEDSDLAICQTRPTAEDGYKVTELDHHASNVLLETPPAVKPRSSVDLSPPHPEPSSNGHEEAESVKVEDEDELLTTQDEADLTLMQETMRSAIERQNSSGSTEQSGADVPDAAAEREEYEKEHWSRNAGLDETTSHLEADDNGTLLSTMQSEGGEGLTLNPMTTTLRPGMFDTLLQTAREPSPRGASLPPLTRSRMAKSVTFASQDEVLADTRDSDLDGATLTEVSVASSSMDMGSVRRSLPSTSSEGDGVANSSSVASNGNAASSDYDDDFEEDDGF